MAYRNEEEKREFKMAIKEAWDKWLDRGIDDDITDLIDMIYNSLESQTCENCRYYRDSTCDNGAVDAMLDPNQEMVDNVQVNKDFGCNKFER